ncbi:sulfite exporter TauE/SafE family protein [Acidihalobacter ferrooxydans]|uniref:Probable membrane transporter protein n=1 Tax=Acidihalobacter ferrooxydans TaxID=1765967 RepID=A0A1P8UJJ9_9GAMM|nr:sulfite exporter TauE/SafE family protein [Acidihalobacter ferrooxydans]APZ44007.1 permease [Acidihalobacter ferrooxydans]
MSAVLLHDGLYFLLTFALATLFAMGGVGSAIALVPTLSMLGLPLNLAKSIGLFVNSSSTITASIMNFRRGVLDIRFTVPLVIAVVLATPVGAWLSRYVPEHIVQWVLAIFLLVSAGLLLFNKREAKVAYDRTWVMLLLGAAVGLVSGLIGVGGGTPILAVLTLLGFDPKKAAYAVSFVIPFSTLSGFFTYLSFVHMDWVLLGVVTVAAILGGYLGGRIMHYRLNAAQVKKLIAVLLLLLAAKMIWSLLA